MLSRSCLFATQALAAVLVSLLATSAHAQKPAITKSVDEPGRSPYHQFVQGTCFAGSCRIAFKAVPTGFRLVVTHLSLIVVSNGLLAYLSDNPAFDGVAAPDGTTNAIVLPEFPRVAGSGLTISSSLVTFYVDAGKSPNIVLTGTGIPSASINGYLVALD